MRRPIVRFVVQLGDYYMQKRTDSAPGWGALLDATRFTEEDAAREATALRQQGTHVSVREIE